MGERSDRYKRLKEIKPKQEADPISQRLLNGDPAVIEEMPIEIDRDAERAMEIERQLGELGGNAKLEEHAYSRGRIRILDIYEKLRRKSPRWRFSMIDIIEFGRFSGNP